MSADTILLVDNKEERLDILRRGLLIQEPGWGVELAGSYSEAVETILRKQREGAPISVMITDWDLEDSNGDGPRLIEEAQKMDPLMMCILYTGYRERLAKVDTRALGIVDVIVKADEENVFESFLEKSRAAL